MPGEEQVLVVPAEIVDFVGFSRMNRSFWDEIHKPGAMRFIRREIAEEDPTYVQLIPYTLLVGLGEWFTYRRATPGKESRLHNLRSMGLGGHVDPLDGPPDRDILMRAQYRELREEVKVKGSHAGEWLGFVFDPSTPVGRVHLGIVGVEYLGHRDVTVNDPALCDAQWMSEERLIAERSHYENWSKCLIEEMFR